MLIKRKRGWEIPEQQATPESVYFSRRKLLGAGASLAAASFFPELANAQRVSDVPDPTAALYPAKKNEKYKFDGRLTEERLAANYNNFYEYGTNKYIAAAAQQLRIRPWQIKFDGMVEKEQTVDFDTLFKAVASSLEERTYRLRCVEAWSAVIPWTGFQMSGLVKFAKPLSGAKYIRMETFNDPKMAPQQRSGFLSDGNWPYIEGCTIAEANNELAFMVTGAYGKPGYKQFGAPIRLMQPWKYGFKAIKSIVRMTFTDKRPVSYWEKLQAQEYGFWANVNPEVSHPRWSQATERDIGTGERRPTVLFNGYGDYVAGLYKDMKGERLWA
jgi:sulfoxide reductase catalytic subunit YedY